jgi:hypothetical protein
MTIDENYMVIRPNKDHKFYNVAVSQRPFLMSRYKSFFDQYPNMQYSGWSTCSRAWKDSIANHKVEGVCTETRPSDDVHLEQWDFLNLLPSCHHHNYYRETEAKTSDALQNANPEYGYCAFTRCGYLSDYPENHVDKYKKCVDSLYLNTCVQPLPHVGRYQTRAADFMSCIRARKCGPRPEGITDQEKQVCSCILTNDKLVKTIEHHGFEKDHGTYWTHQDCPELNRTTTDVNGNAVQTEDEKLILQQRKWCRTNNKNLAAKCEIGSDHKKINSSTTELAKLA